MKNKENRDVCPLGKTDCFAMRCRRCNALTSTDVVDRKKECAFYKSRTQYQEDFEATKKHLRLNHPSVYAMYYSEDM